jgi:hypothetical protein
MKYNIGDLFINSQNRIHTIMNIKEGKHIWTKWFNPFSNEWVNSVYSYKDIQDINWKHFPVKE